MQIERRPVGELNLYEQNAKLHPPEQIEALAKSIAEFGWTVPLLIDGDDTVIAGHGRLMAAKSMGLDNVPTIRLEDMSPEQVQAYRLADNKLAELGDWDEKLLATDLKSLMDDGFDLDFTGFGEGEVSQLLVSGDQFSPQSQPEERLDQTAPTICPSCGHEFHRS